MLAMCALLSRAFTYVNIPDPKNNFTHIHIHITDILQTDSDDFFEALEATSKSFARITRGFQKENMANYVQL